MGDIVQWRGTLIDFHLIISAVINFKQLVAVKTAVTLLSEPSHVGLPN